MNAPRMLEIAQSLGHCYCEKSELTLRIDVARKELDAELLRSTPPEGWAGKNAEERKLAADRAAMENTRAAEQRGIIARAEAALSGLQAGIDSLEAERRALEWEVRSVLALALSGRQETHNNVENAAFDDAQDGALLDPSGYPDDVPVSELEQELVDELSAPTTDDIPF